MIRFSCPHCNKALKADASKIGRLTRCPKCKSPIEVPRSQGESILAEEQFSIIEEPPARMPVPQEPAAQVPAEATYPSPAAWEPEPQKHRTGMLVACLCLTMVLFATIMLAVAIHLHNKQQAMVTVKTEPQALAYGQPVKKQDSVADSGRSRSAEIVKPESLPGGQNGSAHERMERRDEPAERRPVETKRASPTVQIVIKIPDLQNSAPQRVSPLPTLNKLNSAKSPPSNTKLLGEQIAGYKQYSIHGFAVLIHNDVLEHAHDDAFSVTPLEVLETDLGTIATVLPPRCVKVLRQLVVWAEWDDVTDPDYQNVLAKYYGASGDYVPWMLQKGKHPLKANNIEILSMRKFMAEYQSTTQPQRCVLLHEMSHAVHFHIFDYHNQVIRSAYDQAMNRGLYDKSKDMFGRTTVPYARTNPAEYFAELSCAYLSRLNYYPHTRQDLEQHDPVGYRMMELSWGTPKQLEEAFKADAERQAATALKKARRLIANKKDMQAQKALTQLLASYPEAKVAGDAKHLLEILEKPSQDRK